MLSEKRVRELHDDLEALPPRKKQKLTPERDILRPPIYPVKIVKALKQYTYDENGKQYLDAYTSAALVGHCHPKVVEAGSRQLSTLNTNSRFLYDVMVNCAKRLCATLPEKLSCCFFTNSGSEANELALQIAEAVSGYSCTITIEGAKHGISMTLRRLNCDSPCVVPLPDLYRGRYRDWQTAGELYAEEVKKVIKEQSSCGNKVAAFIHESLLCSAGHCVLPPGYIGKVYSCVREAGGLCIADETQLGLGWAGSCSWGFQTQGEGVCPDIVTIGKPMGNGHPVSAVITTKEIAEKFADSGVEYFNTFGGNPVSTAVVDAVLSVIEEERLCDHAEEVGSFLLQGLEGLKEKHMCVGDVRGVGLFIGLDLVINRETREPDKELTKEATRRLLLDHNIIVCAGGMYGNVIKLKPPLCITKEDCSYIIRSIDTILTQLTV